MVVPTAFQVTQKPKPLFGGSAPCMPLGSPKPPVPVASVVIVRRPYSNQSPRFIACFHGGKKIWFGKTTVFGFEVDNASNTVVMKIPVKYANKRGPFEDARQELGSQRRKSGQRPRRLFVTRFLLTTSSPIARLPGLIARKVVVL